MTEETHIETHDRPDEASPSSLSDLLPSPHESIRSDSESHPRWSNRATFEARLFPPDAGFTDPQQDRPDLTGRYDRLDVAARRLRAIELRKLGYAYDDIASKIREEFETRGCPKGYDRRYAWRDVTSELDDLRDEVREETKDLLAIDLQRLEDLLRSFQPKAASGDEKAAAVVLRILEQKARLLGYSEPVQVEHRLFNPADYKQRIEQRRQQAAATLNQQPTDIELLLPPGPNTEPKPGPTEPGPETEEDNDNDQTNEEA